ncbi:MAG: hypothetical protein ACON5B_16890 [Myxococcota bacterium]
MRFELSLEELAQLDIDSLNDVTAWMKPMGEQPRNAAYDHDHGLENLPDLEFEDV